MTAAKDSRVITWARDKIVEIFGADLRSLATFRIVLALLVLADLASRATDLFAHYADDGVLPRDQLLEEGLLDSWDLSLNLINGEPLFQGFVFGVGALAALGLLVGYRTRLVTIIAWVILISIQHRNPMVLNAGDTLLRLLLFWAMFLPLGACWSVDGVRKAASPRLAMRFLSVATVGLFMQIAFMYWFTAILKSGDEWRVDGTALYYALSLDQLTTPLGVYLTQFPGLLKVLTFSTFGLEVFGPFLLFCPFFTGPVRTVAVLMFMSLHYGIYMTMDIGLFPAISALCMVCFLPSWFWDKVINNLRASFPELPDVARRLQRASAGLVRTYLMPLKMRLSALTSVGQAFSFASLPMHGDGPGNGATSGSVALATLEPSTLEEKRGSGSSGGHAERQETPKDAAVESRPVMLRSSLANHLLAAFFLAYISFGNLTTASSFEMPERLEHVGSALSLGQYWNMFAPYPNKIDGWHVLPGNLRSGQEVDLMSVTRDDFNLYRVSWEKPRHVADIYDSNHWRKYMVRLVDDENEDLRLHFGHYVCGEWNARHTGSEQLMTFEIVYMKEESLPDNRRAVPEKEILWEHSCF